MDLSRTLFKFSIIFFSLLTFVVVFFYGIFVGTYQVFPFYLIRETKNELQNQFAHLENDFGGRPTRHLVLPHRQERMRLKASEGHLEEGFRIIAGLTPTESALNGAYLMDHAGKVLHYWPISYETLDRSGRPPTNVFLHGFQAFPNGSILVTFDGGNVLAHLDACGKIIWSIPGHFHHLISVGLNRTVWAWRSSDERYLGEPKNFLVNVDLATGKVLKELSLFDDIILKHDAWGIYGARKSDETANAPMLEDAFHPNDIDVLTPELAEAFPMFNVGDLMLSIRNINLVSVIDSETGVTKWWQAGPWHRQHDPVFLATGVISVFDNNMYGKHSRIVTVDPKTRAIETVFTGTDAQPFYTYMRGVHEYLPNGNILITEPQDGRAFEVKGDSQIVWEYQNIYDEQNNAVINKATWVADNFFERELPDCASNAK